MHRIIHRMFTGKKAPSQAALTALDVCEALRQRVQRLEISHSELVERHEALQKHHNTLRGRVYGDLTNNNRARQGAPTVDSIPFGDKAKLRALALVPGQPPKHEE